MATFKIYRETALPTPTIADTLYVITSATDINYFELYVTNSSNQIRRIVNKADIQAMINASIASANELTIVSDIAARNALAPTTTKYVYVVNATGDATVTSGGATYLFNPTGSTWIKTSEAESLDLAVTWAALTGKPTSAVADIDDAVAKRHEHANMTQLNKVGEDVAGNFTYGGALPSIAWNNGATPSW